MRQTSSWTIPLAWLVFLAAWVYYFIGTGLHTGFTHDDLMNGHRSLQISWSKLLGDAVIFFRPSDLYRPVGGILYKACYDFVGYSTEPLRAVCFTVAILNAWFVFLLTHKLSGNRTTAALASLFYGYHPGLTQIYLSSGFCYDIFSFFFYFLGLLIYTSCKPRPLTYLAVFIMYVLALDSKESAVTFPVMLLLYELLWNGFQIRRMLMPVLTGIATVAFLLGRVYGPAGIGTLGGAYGTGVSITEYLKHLAHFLGEMLTIPNAVQPWHAALCAATLILIAVFRKWNELRFGAAFFLVGILPVAFIQERGMDAVYIAAVGFFLCGAAILTRITPPRFYLALFGVILVLTFRRLDRKPRYISFEEERNHIVDIQEQIKAQYPTLPKGTRILIDKDAYEERFGFGILFQIRLIYNDPTLVVHQRWRLEQGGETVDRSSYQQIWSFENNQLK